MIKYDEKYKCWICLKRTTPSAYMAMLFPTKKVFDLWWIKMSEYDIPDEEEEFDTDDQDWSDFEEDPQDSGDQEEW